MKTGAYLVINTPVAYAHAKKVGAYTCTCITELVDKSTLRISKVNRKSFIAEKRSIGT